MPMLPLHRPQPPVSAERLQSAGGGGGGGGNTMPEGPSTPSMHSTVLHWLNRHELPPKSHTRNCTLPRPSQAGLHPSGPCRPCQGALCSMPEDESSPSTPRATRDFSSAPEAPRDSGGESAGPSPRDLALSHREGFGSARERGVGAPVACGMSMWRPVPP